MGNIFQRADEMLEVACRDLLRQGTFGIEKIGKTGKKFVHVLTEHEVYPPMADIEENEDALLNLDASIPTIEDSGLPGSESRIAAYGEFYGNPQNKDKETHLLTEAEMADRMATNFLSGMYQNTPLGEALKALAIECGVVDAR